MCKKWIWLIGVAMLLASCNISGMGIQPIISTVEPTAGQDLGLPNPASVYCEEQGYRLEIRTDAQGNQYGVCIFPDGSECDEWMYYRGECTPAAEQVQPESATAGEELPIGTAPDELVSYINTDHSFAFEYPAAWTLEEAPQALKLSRDDILIYIAYKRTGEEWDIHWTGMPEGDFVEAGQMPFLGQMLQKRLLVFEDKVKVVTYDLPEETSALLGLDVRVRVDDRHGVSYAETEVSKEVQAETEQILASFRAT
jgi:putative hemolysin